MQSGNRDVLYRYGKNGELLRVFDNSQRLEVTYEYDRRNRETRRVYGNGVTQETLYDKIGRVVMIREGETFLDGSLTTKYAPSGAAFNASPRMMSSNQPTGERYRWVSDGDSVRTRSAEGYTVESGRYRGRGVTLYGNGEAVAVSYNSSTSSRAMYLGKDIMGSVRSVTVDTGSLEDRYEYDAFGTPYKGDLTGGMNLGYTGKPYDSATGLYNYGYRDYKPEAARFTTVDPIRDGSNWFAYVNNDPVNYFDPWGLWDEALQTAVDAHTDEVYASGTNDCDIWVEKVATEGNKTLPSSWSPAKDTTVSQNAKNMNGEIEDHPSPGANIVIHNDNHTILGYLNNDNTFDIAHISSNNEEARVEVTTYDSDEEFETDWTRYGSVQYVPLASPQISTTARGKDD